MIMDKIPTDLRFKILKNTGYYFGQKIEPIKWKLCTSPLKSYAHAYRNPEILIPLLDFFCGIPSVLLDRENNQKSRRELYGKAGSYRYTTYGLEYRTLSNFWALSVPLTSYILGGVRLAVEIAAKAKEYPLIIKYVKANRKYIEHTINNADLYSAKQIVDKKLFPLINKYFIYKGTQDYPMGTYTSQRRFKELVLKGIKNEWNPDTFLENYKGKKIDKYGSVSNSYWGWHTWMQFTKSKYTAIELKELWDKWGKELKEGGSE